MYEKLQAFEPDNGASGHFGRDFRESDLGIMRLELTDGDSEPFAMLHFLDSGRESLPVRGDQYEIGDAIGDPDLSAILVERALVDKMRQIKHD